MRHVCYSLNHIFELLEAQLIKQKCKNDWNRETNSKIKKVLFHKSMPQEQRDEMKKGDKVVTAGGIYGEIKEVQDTTFIITIAKDVTIKVSKDSVFADASDAEAAQAQEKK